MARLLPPISIAQYRRPLADTADATAWHPPSIMFARCGGDCIHMRLAQASVSHPTATFSATAPRRPAKALEARMIEAVATSHIVGVPLSERVQRGTIGMAKAATARL